LINFDIIAELAVHHKAKYFRISVPNAFLILVRMDKDSKIVSFKRPILWLVMDLESTGLHLGRDRITQIAVMAFLTGAIEDSSKFGYAESVCCGRFSCLVWPEISVACDAARISGLTTEILTGQPNFEVQGARLLAWLISIKAVLPDVQPVLVAHNGIRCVAGSLCVS
jgi:DNA polymerase III epsilon subunit-like protein